MPGKSFLTLYWVLILRPFLILHRPVGSETFEKPFPISIPGFHMTSLKLKLKNCWSSEDFILMMKTNIYWYKCSLWMDSWFCGFVIDHAWISKLLRDMAFSWRPKDLSCRLQKVTYFGEFGYLKSSCIRKIIISISFWVLLSGRCFCWFPVTMLVPTWTGTGRAFHKLLGNFLATFFHFEQLFEHWAIFSLLVIPYFTMF